MSLIPLITGPTCSGKSAILYDFIKHRDDYEVVSADAFQVYKYLNIGTAKPDKEILRTIPHHLVDVLDPTDTFNAGDFVTLAEKAIGEILAKGKRPVVAGGTGLYIKSLRDGIFSAPAAPKSLREELKRIELSKLYEELSKVDAESAARIHPNDSVRVIRALEVYKTTGLPLNRAWKELKTEPKYSYSVMAVLKDRQELYADITLRTEEMFERGFIKEVEELLRSGFTGAEPAFRALGYGRVIAALRENAAPLSLEKKKKLTEETAAETRQFAKRQLTWFRGMGVEWLKPQEITERLSASTTSFSYP